MGGLDWEALPVIVELHDPEDIELFIQGLKQIRHYQQQLNQE